MIDLDRLRARKAGIICAGDIDARLDRIQARWAADNARWEAEYRKHDADLTDEDEAQPTPKAAAPPKLLSVNEAAQHLTVTADQVKAFAKDGELRYIDLGRGKHRPRMRFTIADLDEFIERRQRRDVPCQSTGKATRRISTSISKPVVIGFTALRAAHLAKKPKSSKR